MITRSDQWAVPRRVWMILLSWGLTVIVLAGLFSFWTWSNQLEDVQERERIQREDVQERERIRIEQVRAMCELTGFLISSGATPPPGPEGDRAREGAAKMRAYRATLLCDQLPPPR